MFKHVTKLYGYRLTIKEFQAIKPTKCIIALPTSSWVKAPQRQISRNTEYAINAVNQDLVSVTGDLGQTVMVDKKYITITERELD
jgi:hypothetical protein